MRLAAAGSLSRAADRIVVFRLSDPSRFVVMPRSAAEVKVAEDGNPDGAPDSAERTWAMRLRTVGSFARAPPVAEALLKLVTRALNLLTTSCRALVSVPLS